LVGFYREPDATRAGELLECLRRNCDNARIDAVHVFLEDGAQPELAHAKLRFVQLGRRLLYKDLFDYANGELKGRRVIIANSDIYFDHSLAWLDEYDLSGKLLCLSRWDVRADGTSHLFEFASSQDAWMFTAPIRPFACDWHLGKPGCENRLAYEAAAAGLQLANPSRSVHAHHLHLSRVINYRPSDRIPGPGRSIEPTFLDGDAGPRRPSTIYALTSLSPSPAKLAEQRACVASWRRAGLEVRSFNHPSEIAQLARAIDVEFVPVSDTTERIFAHPFVPIGAFLDWAQSQRAHVLIINSDIELNLTPWQLRRLRWLARGGLCYFVRYNHVGVKEQATREAWGIDAFLLDGAYASLFPRSFLSMGRPFWDYWLPHTFAAHGLPIFSVEFPVAFHRNHAQGWSWEDWHRCALEFDRMAHVLVGDRAFHPCSQMSIRVRQEFERKREQLSSQLMNIRSWVEQTFRGPERKVFLELGAHVGSDTVWMAALPNVTLHAFEPDPRNHVPALPNVVFNRAAVSDRDGRSPLLLSREGWGREWTYSSSLKQPKNHLQRYPVTFGDTVEVETVRLDSYCERHGLGAIDFIWADIQGAEGEMVRGGLATLQRTHYVYTEYSDDEMYGGQATLDELLALLPQFSVLELWEDDVLLVNRQWQR
jgi:FkbM family methyltransferase